MSDLGPSADVRIEGFPFYRGPRLDELSTVKPAVARTVHSMPRHAVDDPSRYRPHPDLEAAVNTALLLGMPLIVTGEPGCGKTQLGEAVAYALGLRHEKFETKSTSLARDLFYEFDVVGRFQARDSGASADAHRFIEYRALGKAILMAHRREDVADLLPSTGFDFHPGAPVRSVITIDEIDKAPRDFPNDILNEIDRMYFRVPELGPAGLRGTPGADGNGQAIAGHLRPIVILTSNSEKRLPEAFLRRCVFINIPDPSREQVRAIVFARLGEYLGAGGVGIEQALSFFMWVRDPRRGIGKRPGMAELLNWLQAMAGAGIDPAAPLDESRTIALATMTALFKTSEDLTRARPDTARSGASLYEQWHANEVEMPGRQSRSKT